MHHWGIDLPREGAAPAAVLPTSRVSQGLVPPLLWEHLGSELGRQNRFQEAPLVGSQRGKVARGKTHKQNTLTLKMANTRVRHLLKVNSALSGNFYCCVGIGAVPVNKEVHNPGTRWRHCQQVPERAFLFIPAQHRYLEPHPSATPAMGLGGDCCKGN